MTNFINGIEVPELTQEQMNTIIERRLNGGHAPTQNGDTFCVSKTMIAIDTYLKKHNYRGSE